MPSNIRFTLALAAVVAAAVFGLQGLNAPENVTLAQAPPSPDPVKSPNTPKISQLAPAVDLLQQIDFFIGRVEESLSDPADFDLAKQARTLKDGNTLAALALVLSLSDEEHPSKAAMPRLLQGAQALAVVEDKVDKAQAALAEIKAARAGTADDSPPVKWEKVASLPALMKQVPLVHAGLKRNVEGNRLARSAAQSAGQAAALVAIAQASMWNTEDLKTSQEIARWQQLCAEMRDVSGEVNSAVHAKDQARVTAGMKRLLKSCDDCHAEFRK